MTEILHPHGDSIMTPGEDDVTHVTFSEPTHEYTRDHKTADHHDNPTFLAPGELHVLEAAPTAQDLNWKELASAPSREPHRDYKVTNDTLWSGGGNRGIPRGLSRMAAGKDDEDDDAEEMNGNGDDGDENDGDGNGTGNGELEDLREDEEERKKKVAEQAVREHMEKYRKKEEEAERREKEYRRRLRDDLKKSGLDDEQIEKVLKDRLKSIGYEGQLDKPYPCECKECRLRSQELERVVAQTEAKDESLGDNTTTAEESAAGDGSNVSTPTTPSTEVALSDSTPSRPPHEIYSPVPPPTLRMKRTLIPRPTALLKLSKQRVASMSKMENRRYWTAGLETA